MSEIVVVGTFTAKAGKEREAAAAFEGLVVPTHDEDGCILYALHRGLEDPRRLTFVERWESVERLEAHMESDHIKAVLDKVPYLFDETDITAFEAMPGGQRVKGSLADHAAG